MLEQQIADNSCGFKCNDLSNDYNDLRIPVCPASNREILIFKYNSCVLRAMIKNQTILD